MIPFAGFRASGLGFRGSFGVVIMIPPLAGSCHFVKESVWRSGGRIPVQRLHTLTEGCAATEA